MTPIQGDWERPSETPPAPRRREWAATVIVVLVMLLVPAGFLVLLSAQGGEAADEPPRSDATPARSKTDRGARMTFHVRPQSVGMRILRGAPRATLRVRGREVRVVCGSVSGLITRTARWPRRKPTLTVDMPRGIYRNAEFCSVKRGRRTVSRVVLR